MKITAQEEYGLRILLTIAKHPKPDGLSIPQISKSQGLSEHYVGKLTRILRLSEFLKSTRGKIGGYLLNKPADQINLKDVLKVLGGSLYGPDYCKQHSGIVKTCPNSGDCSVRTVWQNIQTTVDGVLENITIQDLMKPEKDFLKEHFQKNNKLIKSKVV